MSETIEKAKLSLENRGVILYPTDTIWGLGCDATNDDACERLLKIKERDESKSLIILVDSFHMIERYIPEFPEVCYDLVELATRPLTIVYPNAHKLSHHVLAADGSVGIRLTKDPICLQLIKSMRKPLVSTSANFSGQKSPGSFSEIDPKLIEMVDAVVEERTTERMEKASQIIKIGLNYSIEIIRK